MLSDVELLGEVYSYLDCVVIRNSEDRMWRDRLLVMLQQRLAQEPPKVWQQPHIPYLDN